jgi:hypothetical protein
MPHPAMVNLPRRAGMERDGFAAFWNVRRDG